MAGSTPLLPPRFDPWARLVAVGLDVLAGLILIVSGFAIAFLGDGRITAAVALTVAFLVGLSGFLFRLAAGATFDQLEAYLIAFRQGALPSLPEPLAPSEPPKG